MGINVEIVAVGNELLIGKTLNTNAHWLATRITSLGASVNRITVVGDDLCEIATALTEALERKTQFIVTTGGLGPTFDDKTLEGIAKGLKRKLETNREALTMVKSRYERLEREAGVLVEMTPARIKMATFPEKATALPNPVGTAPAMMASVDGACLIALPGVPPEMMAIFDESVAPLLKRKTRNRVLLEKSIYLDGIMESSLAPLIDKVMKTCPGVYIKSHVYSGTRPRVEGKKSHIELHFSMPTQDTEVARNLLKKAVRQMASSVRKEGGKVSLSGEA